ncbi:ABC transporter ATP-binding protein [Anaerocolumna cellulosilytica]|uniref:ABC transporter ATP-binding protein n=1 Tax=Anaerocolumna cellulosilytica TaxID=433286 RepID=A0A6S6RBJ3_9FIRM|nr:ABC transporter ATP-binding protein [Anaerocolumna cellulosilytica]MBB5197568.1 ABC-type multidrug transport system fused ATPase/permease subunit [Anaerocolumna cellulosilytica]BCJ96592.1 ABC transporter ATP-binding protein [Anaerocolumna cellulosilytica]
MKKTKNKPEGKQDALYSLGNNYTYVYKNMWEYRKSLVGYGIAEVIFNVLTPFGLIIIPSVVVKLLLKSTPVMNFITILTVMFALYGIVAGISSFLIARNRMQYIDFRCDRFWIELLLKCLTIDYQIMESEQVKKDLEKAMECLNANQLGMEGFMHRNVKLISNVIGLILYACIISMAHPIILALLIAISLIQMLVFNRAKYFEQNKRNDMVKLKVTQRYLQEQAFDLKAGKDIRMYQLNHVIKRMYKKANQELKQIKIKIQSFFYLNDVVGILLRFIRDGVCYGYLIYRLMNGLEVSYFVLYLGVVSGFAKWFTTITEDIAEISRFHLMICDYRKFVDMEERHLHKGGLEITGEDSALDIVFEHVSFCYEGAENNVLTDVSFHMKKGEKLALVGINGAGKSTIVKLMCGFYQPTKGRILVNGIDMKELDIEKYFKQIAVVFQDAFTMSFTIAENISGEITEKVMADKMEKVLKLSGLFDKVNQLEKGLHTYLNKDMDESGIQLSGGELQKLMLARAIYKNAQLLILDEPTAALDAISESELYERYQMLLKGRTSLFISHRLASTRFCDKIIFLENGCIAEEGSHDELLQLNGTYAKMFQVQGKYYQEVDIHEVQETMA